MIMKDCAGRAYALVSEVAEGDVLEADDYFDCMEVGDRFVVYNDGNGNLYLQCDEEYHSLEGQWEDNDGKAEPYYIGLYKIKDFADRY